MKDLKNPNEHSFFIKEVTPDEILKKLKNLNTKKASDICGISPKLIKIGENNFKKHLAEKLQVNISITNI